MQIRKNNNPPLYATADEVTAFPGSEVISENVVFIDVEAERILGQKNACDNSFCPDRERGYRVKKGKYQVFLTLDL